jgi:hypothetical protein
VPKTRFQPLLIIGWRLMSALGRGLWSLLASDQIRNVHKITCLAILTLGLVVAPIVYFAKADEPGNGIRYFADIGPGKAEQGIPNTFSYSITPGLTEKDGKYYLGLKLDLKYKCPDKKHNYQIPFIFNKTNNKFETKARTSCAGALSSPVISNTSKSFSTIC